MSHSLLFNEHFYLKAKFLIHFVRLFLMGALLFLVVRPCFGGGWYVGNTASGEWIQYTNVWLSAGGYRLTPNAGSPPHGALIHLGNCWGKHRPRGAGAENRRNDFVCPL